MISPLRTFTCCDCGATFETSAHAAKRCPTCRAAEKVERDRKAKRWRRRSWNSLPWDHLPDGLDLARDSAVRIAAERLLSRLVACTGSEVSCMYPGDHRTGEFDEILADAPLRLPQCVADGGRRGRGAAPAP